LSKYVDTRFGEAVDLLKGMMSYHHSTQQPDSHFMDTKNVGKIK